MLIIGLLVKLKFLEYHFATSGAKGSPIEPKDLTLLDNIFFDLSDLKILINVTGK